MADKKISELTSLTGANAADGDLVAIVDVSATETKKITRSEFFTDTPSIDVGGTVTATGLDINGDADVSGNITLSQAVSSAIKRTDNTGSLSLQAGENALNPALVMYGNAHATLANWTVLEGNTMLFRPVDNSPEYMRFIEDTGVVFNETAADVDFRIESDTNAYAFFLQGSDGRIGIGTSSPQANLDVTGETGNQLVVATNTNAANTEAGILFKHATTVNNFDGGGVRSVRSSTTNDFGLALDVGRDGVSTQAMFISGADATPGYVGIGTDSPSEKLHISQDSAFKIQMERTGGTPSVCEIANSGNLLNISNNVNGIALLTGATPTETMRVDASGHAIIPNGVTLGTAAGTYNAANTLDDYEEGTWTPTYAGTTAAGSFTYDIQEGYYTKIGNVVTVTGRLRTDAASGATGNAYIDGLPFTPKNVTNAGSNGCGSLGQTGDFNTEYPVGVYAGDNQARLFITTQPSANSTINVMNAANGFLNAANANGLFFSCTYVTG